jgi:hypothetical protein
MWNRNISIRAMNFLVKIQRITRWKLRYSIDQLLNSAMQRVVQYSLIGIRIYNVV